MREVYCSLDFYHKYLVIRYACLSFFDPRICQMAGGVLSVKDVGNNSDSSHPGVNI